MKITMKENNGFKLVHFELAETGVDPKEAAKVIKENSESFSGAKVVLFSGRGSVWVYGMFVHAAHATPNVATYDPRKSGFVVVTSHNGKWSPGEIIPSPEVGMIVDNGKIISSDA